MQHVEKYQCITCVYQRTTRIPCRNSRKMEHWTCGWVGGRKIKLTDGLGSYV